MLVVLVLNKQYNIFVKVFKMAVVQCSKNRVNFSRYTVIKFAIPPCVVSNHSF